MLRPIKLDWVDVDCNWWLTPKYKASINSNSIEIYGPNQSNPKMISQFTLEIDGKCKPDESKLKSIKIISIDHKSKWIKYQKYFKFVVEINQNQFKSIEIDGKGNSNESNLIASAESIQFQSAKLK